MFRAWSKCEKKYIYDFCMTNSGVIINKVYPQENYIIEQYTGTKWVEVIGNIHENPELIVEN